MNQGIYTIKENTRLTPTTWRMKLEGEVRGISAPGQFINIRLGGHFLRRPISICDLDRDGITIIYKVLGHGTEEMTRLACGEKLDVLTGLGNGYSRTDAGDRPLLIGGGVGIPPLYLTARLLDPKPTVILGYNSSDEMFLAEAFRALGCHVVVATADGSYGISGFVTDAFEELISQGGTFTHFYACGPEPMLKAVYEKVYKEAGISGQMSFEERMGCGFGACMGCSMKTKDGYKRICKDGPVFRTEELPW